MISCSRHGGRCAPKPGVRDEAEAGAPRGVRRAPRAGAERAARCGEVAVPPAGACRRDRPLRHGSYRLLPGALRAGRDRSARSCRSAGVPRPPRARASRGTRELRTDPFGRGHGVERAARSDGRHHRRAAPGAARRPRESPDARLAAASLVGGGIQRQQGGHLARCRHRFLEDAATRRALVADSKRVDGRQPHRRAVYREVPGRMGARSPGAAHRLCRRGDRAGAVREAERSRDPAAEGGGLDLGPGDAGTEAVPRRGLRGACLRPLPVCREPDARGRVRPVGGAARLRGLPAGSRSSTATAGRSGPARPEAW